ncbi:hypothetical protein BV898_08273 [Hypsibius exemplaris]|uniref:DDE Tnp4 domain-containing protein n=1 Tax=Hypsibius exemplaris TaxID=2072580 RepID=A0A1W0WR32_HYPEX|nr:hypothetical protein BV898_08273 [Hypsibius exemplaris]
MKYKSLLLAYANGLLTDEEFVLLRRRPPRVKHKYRARAFSLPATSAEHCKDLFRVEKADIMRIIRFLDMPEKFKLKGRLSVSVSSGKERCHGLKYQAITAPDGLILHLASPFEGARHDASTYLESQAESMLREKMEEVGGQFRLYGDPAYTLSDYLITPFRKATQRNEIEFNQITARVRIAVGWSFGKVLQLYAYSDFSKNLKIDRQPVAKYYIVSTFLANLHTCIYQSQIRTKFGVVAPSLEEYLQCFLLL